MDLRGSLRAEGLSVRGIFNFVLAVLMTAFLWVLVGTTTPANAAGDATWSGENLVYQNEQYYSAGNTTANDGTGIAKDSPYYIHTGQGLSTDTVEAYLIYFSTGTDPTTATSATYVEYVYNTDTRTYSNPQNSQTITVDASTAGTGSSCTIDGVGWIVCTLSNFLAGGMDWIYDKISMFMVVEPIITDQSSDLYRAWDIMRNVANISFIIIFLIIIYSQLTSIGISNYGLKKLLPKLVVAAILVNVSYIISALAVDLSNALGYAIQDMFMNIRSEVFSTGQEIDWMSMTEFILSGGTIAAGGLGYAYATAATAGGTVEGLIYMLLLLLIGLILIAIVVLIILAARQAIIIIFIILSPLALVANLLPNTEKWFERWKDTFVTMLVFFPAFSIVFGGSQLAGTIITNSANDIVMLLLGMAVQVAPLAIIPLIIKLSGGLLGKVAGIVNNKNKGLYDRTKKWSDKKVKAARERGVSGAKFNGKPGELKKWNFARRAARRAYNRRRGLEDKYKNFEDMAENTYKDSPYYRSRNEVASEIAKDKEIIEARNTKHIEKMTADPSSSLHAKHRTLMNETKKMETTKAKTAKIFNDEINEPDSELHSSHMKMEQAKHALAASEATTKRITEEYKAGEHAGSVNAEMSRVARNMLMNSNLISAESRGAVAAQNIQKVRFARELETEAVTGNLRLTNIAASIDPNGAQRALADAYAVISKNSKESVENAKVIVDYHNLTDNEKQQLILGHDIIDPARNRHIRASVDMIKAAQQSLLDGGSPAVISEAIRNADYTNLGLSKEDVDELYASLGATISSSKLRPAFLTFGVLARLKQRQNADGSPLTSYGQDGWDKLIIDAINSGSLSVDTLQTMPVPFVNDILGAVRRRHDDIQPDGLDELRQNLDMVLNPEVEGNNRLSDAHTRTYRDIRASL